MTFLRPTNTNFSRSEELGVPPDGPLLLLSPHMDDAALSCAALIERGEPLDVLTVCTGVPDPPTRGDWDRLCGFPTSTESVTARRAEEEAAFAGSGHRLATLDLLESQHLDAPRAEADAQAVSRAVARWCERNRQGTVALPACAGRSSAALEAVFGRPTGRRRARLKRLTGPAGRWVLARGHRAVVPNDEPVVHGDHRFVRDAALRAMRDAPGARALLYEEVPYLWGAPADREAARAAADAGLRLSAPVTVPVNRPAKARRVSAYRSQLPHLYQRSGSLDTPEGLPPLERYWWLSREDAAD